MKLRTRPLEPRGRVLCCAAAVPRRRRRRPSRPATLPARRRRAGRRLPGATVTAVAHRHRHQLRGGHRRRRPLQHPERPRRRLQGRRQHERLQGSEAGRRSVVELGAEKTVDFKLQLATVSETVDVVATRAAHRPRRAPAPPTTSPNAVKESLPTISRSLNDIVRISPMFNAQGGGAGDQASVVSVAGNSHRYNSLQIDGAVNNDLFGLASSAGTPGGTAGDAADQPRRDPGNPARRLALRRAPGRLLGRRHQRDHQERHQQLHGTGVLLRPQPGLGRQGLHRTRRSRRSRTSRAAAASAVRS